MTQRMNQLRALAASCVLLVGCAGPVGVDLLFTPDPNLNRSEDVLSAIDSIVLIVDSEEALYAPGEERSDDSVQIENADSDPGLELVVTVPVLDALPRVRLEQGSLPDRPLDLRLLGVPAEAGAPARVTGRVQGVRLTQPIQEIAVPFNLRPEALPPRVTEVLPTDGSSIPGCAISKLYVMFSRPVDPATVTDSIRVEPGRVVETRLDPSGLTAELTIADLESEGVLTYRVEVDATLRGLDGQDLDQVPAEDGAQSYRADFELGCGRAPMVPDPVCEPGPATPQQGCSYPRLACVEGFCVPTGCDEAVCDDASVCDPADGRCVVDCRPWDDDGVCPEERPVCSAGLGTCVAPSRP
ncbi:MAG: Ig-like domain-containing protein [Sandaracinaceae bacterium]